ncbi:MAG: hypothetical protein AB7S70_03105 [Hyphomicrobium sp.]|uniref:hypothetical protein n=1 Tax=Hyphomicrobium sp. TaxID=82 RepID=UPI003D0A0A95
MTPISNKLGAALAATLVLAAAAVPAANAAYLGYGNGDPGNWDFWTEQNGGKPMTMSQQAAPQARITHRAVHHAKHGQTQKVAHVAAKKKQS